MHLENLILINFKNYSEQNIQFSTGVNSLVGDNGSGKTNLLDAIYYLSMTKSAFNTVDSQTIKHDESFYSLMGRFSSEKKKWKVGNALNTGQKKKVSIDKKVLNKASEIIGKFPVVMIAPSDSGLIEGGSEARRRFFDSIICQIDKYYLNDLVEYNQALKRRNKLLKQFAESNVVDRDLLEPYDALLLGLGERICKGRKVFCEAYLPVVLQHFKNISDGREDVSVTYESEFLEPSFREIFYDSYKKDLILQRTNTGIHKDDFIFEIDGYALKKFGSQGQQKSFLIALKLGQFDVIRNEKGHKPIVLLDDIFDKLDDHRIQKLIEMTQHHEFGQVFITDARPERTKTFLKDLPVEKKIFLVQAGQLEEIDF